MVNVALVVTSVVFAILIIIASIYFLVYFQHPDDRLVAWFPKFVVVLGLSVAAYNIFLLPLDVANQQGSFDAPGAIPIREINLSFFTITIIMGMLIVPFTVFYYEGVDDSDESDTKRSSKSQMQYAFKWMIPTIIFVIGLLCVLYWAMQLGKAEIAITYLRAYMVGEKSATADMCGIAEAGDPTKKCAVLAKRLMDVDVSFLVFTIALFNLIGWTLLATFGGVGLVALPYDLILEFVHRPKPIKEPEYREKKKLLGEQAKILLDVGNQLVEERRMQSRNGAGARAIAKFKRKEREFRRDSLILEYHYQWLEDAFKKQGGNFIIQCGKFALGIIGAILSFFWIFHICIYVVPVLFQVDAVLPFLNEFFISLADIPFLGVFFYALFAFYLLMCVIKGNIKLGFRVLFFTLHPMKVGETFMSSLVFNVGLILFSSLAITHFCTMAFEDYARYTASSTIFVVQMQNLKNIKYSFYVFVLGLLLFALVTFFFATYRPFHKGKNSRISKMII